MQTEERVSCSATVLIALLATLTCTACTWSHGGVTGVVPAEHVYGVSGPGSSQVLLSSDVHWIAGGITDVDMLIVVDPAQERTLLVSPEMGILSATSVAIPAAVGPGGISVHTVGPEAWISLSIGGDIVPVATAGDSLVVFSPWRSDLDGTRGVRVVGMATDSMLWVAYGFRTSDGNRDSIAIALRMPDGRMLAVGNAWWPRPRTKQIPWGRGTFYVTDPFQQRSFMVGAQDGSLVLVEVVGKQLADVAVRDASDEPVVEARLVRLRVNERVARADTVWLDRRARGVVEGDRRGVARRLVAAGRGTRAEREDAENLLAVTFRESVMHPVITDVVVGRDGSVLLRGPQGQSDVVTWTLLDVAGQIRGEFALEADRRIVAASASGLWTAVRRGAVTVIQWQQYQLVNSR